MKVSNSEFRDQRFPMPDGIEKYAWFSGPRSANGKLQLTGLLKPNPLGLFDMLGNVDEMMMTPFHLNKLNRLQGQAGGYVVRGGSYLTPESNLSSSLRDERPFYAANQAENDKSKATGLRMAFVAPVLTSKQRIGELEQAWAKLGATPSKKQPELDPQAQVASLADQTQDKALKKQLDKLRQDLRANTLERDEQRDLAIQSELQLGAFLCVNLKADKSYLDLIERTYKQWCSNKPEDGTADQGSTNHCENRKQNVEKQRERVAFLSSYYADTLVGAADNYGITLLKKQIPLVEQKLRLRKKNSNLVAFLHAHGQNLTTYLSGDAQGKGKGLINQGAWLENCTKVD